MRNKIHACMAHRWNKTKKKTVLRIRLGRDPGRSSRPCSREQDRELNGLIVVLGTRIPSAALQTIESAAESEIGPRHRDYAHQVPEIEGFGVPESMPIGAYPI